MTAGSDKQSESPFCRDLQREQKRRAILSEAANLFNSKGTRATTLEDIAACLGLTKTTLYYYVKSKEELMYQCYLASCDRFEEILDDAENRGGQGSEGLASFIRGYFQSLKAALSGQQPHYALLTEIRALRQEYRTEVAHRYSLLFKRVKRMVRQGVEDGSIVPCEELDTALAIFGVVQLSVIWLPEVKVGEIDQAAEDFIDLVLNGVATLDEFVLGDFPGIPDLPAGFDREAQRLKKQEAFFKAGSSFFNRKGFKGTSLDEIAESLDVTKGAFYYHIKDKEELLFHCFQRSLAITNRMQDMAEQNARNGLEELQICALYLFHIQNSNDGPLIRFNLIPSLSVKRQRDVLRQIKATSNRFGKMIRKGMADGSIREMNPFIAEQILTSAINISEELRWMRPVVDIKSSCQSFFSFYFRGIEKKTPA